MCREQAGGTWTCSPGSTRLEQKGTSLSEKEVVRFKYRDIECLCGEDNKHIELTIPSACAVWSAKAVYFRMIWANFKDGFLTSSNVQTIPISTGELFCCAEYVLMPLSDIKSGGNQTSGLTQGDSFYVLKIGHLPAVSVLQCLQLST